MSNSFYGGKPGKSFTITKLFTQVRKDTSNPDSNISLWSDLTKESSDVPIGSYVLVSYGEPGSRLDKKDPFYTHWAAEWEQFNKHFHGSIWRKSKYDYQFIETMENSPSVIGYDTVLGDYKLLTYESGNLDKTKAYYVLILNTAVEGLRGDMGTYERVISCMADATTPSELHFLKSDKNMFKAGDIHSACEATEAYLDDYTADSYILDSTTFNQIVGIEVTDATIHTIMFVIGNPNGGQGSGVTPDDEGTYDAYGLLCTYDTISDPPIVKSMPIDISDNILKTELFINSPRTQDSENVFGFDSRTMGYSGEFMNSHFIFVGNQLPLQAKNPDGSWDNTDVADYAFGYNIWFYTHDENEVAVEYNQPTSNFYSIKDCYSESDSIVGESITNIYEDAEHTILIIPSAEDAIYYDSYRNIESTPNTYYQWAGKADDISDDQIFVRIPDLV